MKIHADRGLCEGHGQCNLVSEELFPLNDDGYIDIGDEGNKVPDEDEDTAEEGIHNCPVQALSLAEQ